jgi:hypothetical protein
MAVEFARSTGVEASTRARKENPYAEMVAWLAETAESTLDEKNAATLTKSGADVDATVSLVQAAGRAAGVSVRVQRKPGKGKGEPVELTFYATKAIKRPRSTEE